MRRARTVELICGTCGYRFEWRVDSPSRAAGLFVVMGGVAFFLAKYAEDDFSLAVSALFGILAVWWALDFLRQAVHSTEPRCRACNGRDVVNVLSERGKKLNDKL